MTDRKALVDKLWNYCNILRDDGLSYGDYVELRRAADGPWVTTSSLSVLAMHRGIEALRTA